MAAQEMGRNLLDLWGAMIVEHKEELHNPQVYGYRKWSDHLGGGGRVMRNRQDPHAGNALGIIHRRHIDMCSPHVTTATRKAT
ncbi:hypothetical protein PR048_030356 [Dryococelus australis]|uniref:Uncharacterized protein n=1 Tax=Dryococelus australis TaxID=614101 RepID=A0ABQ9G8R6_9NEOP|nr:hypothetical protein PR048_030356 [Dryococelus australis]